MNIANATELLKNIISIPAGFSPYSIHEVKHDMDDVLLCRFTKHSNQCEWGGEHFSVTIDQHQQLKGFIHLEESMETDTLPSQDEAQTLAFSFLRQHAPDLIDTAEIRWIRPLRKQPIASPHDDGFLLSSGTIITGMRVKLFINSNNKYGWVIVGKKGQVINFERDVEWSVVQKRRTTERWLHDAWAQNNLPVVSVQAA